MGKKDVVTDTAIASVVTGLVTVATMSIGFLTLWLKLRYGIEKTSAMEGKLDYNTALTRNGVDTTNRHLSAAADVAQGTRKATENIERKLNGGIDAAITSAILPVKTALSVHMEDNSARLGEMDERFKGLTDYVHQRNHDILDALHSQNLKLTLLMKACGAGGTNPDNAVGTGEVK